MMKRKFKKMAITRNMLRQTLYLPPEPIRKLKRYAYSQGLPLTFFIRKAIEEYIQNHKIE